MAKNLNDLPASELARLDAICLDFESKLRAGDAPSVDDLVSKLGGQNADLLRDELNAIAQEVSNPPPSNIVSETNQPASSVSDIPVPNAPVQANRDAATDLTENDLRLDGSALGSKPIGEIPRPGDFIGPYRIDRELGRGGMGVVLGATDPRLDRTVAIKMLAITGKHYEELADRFKREAKAVARISHPNVVELFDIGTHNGLPYAVMEFLQGELLVDYQQRKRPSAAEVRLIGAQIAEALAKSHEFGVIHRDLKPHNVMLTHRSNEGSNEATLVASGLDSDGIGGVSNPQESASTSIRVKLFDFGLSRTPLKGREMDPDEMGSDVDSQTRAGMILGTPGYMAPEQARGEAVSPAADIFSLGCVLHEIFYGQRAFDGNTPADRFAAALRGTPTTDPQRLQEDPALASIIEDCLQKNVDDRPSSAAEVAVALRGGIPSDGLASVVRPSGMHLPDATSTSTSEHQFSRRRFVESVAGGLAGLSIAGWWDMQNSAAMRSIESIGVLTLVDKISQLELGQSEPIGPRPATNGEQLSVSLVNALSQAEDLTVAKFFPLVATNTSEYVAAAKKLDVDALVDGQFRRIGSPGSSDQILEVDLQVISGTTGKLLWADTVKVSSGNSLVERKSLASKLADLIGRGIRSTGEEGNKNRNPEVFQCINKGVAAINPDRIDALQSSLDCFRHAAGVDESFVEALAGVATVSLMLANRVRSSERDLLINSASDHIGRALLVDQQHPTVRLANAMYAWQIDHDYATAAEQFEGLSEARPNDWQIQHQRGLLALTVGEDIQALRHLNRSARLARPIRSIQTDVVRAMWYRNVDLQRAITDATVLLEEAEDDSYARGLLIDLYEAQADYRNAAAMDPEFGEVGGATPTTISKLKYFERRLERLEAIPYGPYDPESNRLIHLLRSDETLLDLRKKFSEWKRSSPPSMPLLLARHPAFRPMRLLDDAQLMLPSNS